MKIENSKMNAKGILLLLEDYFINEVITVKEMKDILNLPIEEFNDFVNNYTLKGK